MRKVKIIYNSMEREREREREPYIETAKTDEQGRALLKSLGMPFRN